MAVWILYVPGRPPLAAFASRGEAIAEAYAQARFGVTVLLKRLALGWPDADDGEVPEWI